MKFKFLHWWYGCEKFNRIYSFWNMYPGIRYPECTICGEQCWWTFGIADKAPDYRAIEIIGRRPNREEMYKSVMDEQADKLPRHVWNYFNRNIAFWETVKHNQLTGCNLRPDEWEQEEQVEINGNIIL